MARKPNPFNPFGDDMNAAQLGESVRASAQQIWLAGLGAFAKAQEEGTKVFDTLVKEGVGLQRKTQATAEEKLNEAASKMSNLAGDLSARAAGGWDKLEGIFETRVAKALKNLHTPSASDLATLSARIDELTRSVHQLEAKSKASATARRSVAKTSRPAAAAPAKRPARSRPPKTAE